MAVRKFSVAHQKETGLYRTDKTPPLQKFFLNYHH